MINRLRKSLRENVRNLLIFSNFPTIAVHDHTGSLEFDVQIHLVRKFSNTF